MDEPWWEGRVASDVHCTLREKVSPSPPSWLSGWAFKVPFALDSDYLGDPVGQLGAPGAFRCSPPEPSRGESGLERLRWIFLDFLIRRPELPASQKLPRQSL